MHSASKPAGVAKAPGRVAAAFRASNTTFLRGASPGVVLVIVVAVYAGLFATNFWQHVVNGAFVYVVLSASLYVAIGLGKLVSFGHAAFFAIGGYTVALLTTAMGWPFWPTMIASILTGALSGVVAGLPSLRVSGHYLALVTLGFAVVVQSVLKNWTEVTQGNDGIAGIPGVPMPWGVAITESDYTVILSALAVIVIVIVALIEQSRLGRQLKAVAEGEQFAELIGVPTARVKILGFAVSAALASVGGAFYAPWLGYVDPSMSSLAMTVTILIFLAVGGASTLTGAVVGALVLSVLQEALRSFGEARNLIFMSIAALVLLLAPDGIVGRLTALWAMFRRRSERRPHPDVESLTSVDEEPELARAKGAGDDHR